MHSLWLLPMLQQPFIVDDLEPSPVPAALEDKPLSSSQSSTLQEIILAAGDLWDHDISPDRDVWNAKLFRTLRGLSGINILFLVYVVNIEDKKVVLTVNVILPIPVNGRTHELALDDDILVQQRQLIW